MLTGITTGGGYISDLLAGKRSMTTFRKLPIAAPSIPKTIIKYISTVLIHCAGFWDLRQYSASNILR